MTPFQGFSDQLQTPDDLLGKLRHDLERMERDPHDAYAAFDFFVTAEHIVDWRWPSTTTRGSSPRADLERDREPMKTVSHLASSGKHFKAKAKRHTTVSDVPTRPGAFQADAFQADAFDTGGLVLKYRNGRRVSLVAFARTALARCEMIVAGKTRGRR